MTQLYHTLLNACYLDSPLLLLGSHLGWGEGLCEANGGKEGRKGIKDIQTEMRYTVMFRLCLYSLTLVTAEFSFLVNNVS